MKAGCRIRFVLIAAAGFLLLTSVGALAQCIDVVDPDAELPTRITTDKGTDLTFTYDLVREQYQVFVTREGKSTGPHGPFTLSRACLPATFFDESREHVLLETGCGTFCWDWLVLPAPGAAAGVSIVERPLAFDSARELVARYAEQDTIEISNLVTGRSQRIETRLACETFSGLCFSNVRIEAGLIRYVWHYDGSNREFTEPLVDELVR